MRNQMKTHFSAKQDLNMNTGLLIKMFSNKARGGMKTALHYSLHHSFIF